MTFDDYGIKALSTAMYKDDETRFICGTMGLAGEAGEFVEKVKKILRDKKGVISSKDNKLLLYELGDVLWKVNLLADYLGSNLEEIAKMNIDKLASRKLRDMIHGEGDER